MKRYLLFILAIGFGLIAFGQNRSAWNSKKNIVAPLIRRSIDNPIPGEKPVNLVNSGRSITTDPATMVTRYDLQTNSSSGQQRLYYWPSDNKMSAVATWSTQDATWTDRGTGYNYFNGTSWGSLPTSRVETIRTGWPSIQPFGANGECILSHTNTTLRFCKRTSKGTGTWTESSLPNPSGVPAMLWPRMVASGTTSMNIHLIALTEPVANGGTTYNGMDGALLYIRSTDGGSTWGTWQQLPGMTSSNYLNFTSDIYAFAQPHGDTIAFTVGDSWQDQFLMKSNNNGTSWTKTIIYNSPYNLGGNSTGFFYCPDGTMTVALDKQGIAHVVFGLVSDSGSQTASYFKPFTDGLAYWNETMPQLPQSLDPNILLINNQLVGWVQDTMVFYPPYGVGLANYYTGLSSQPTMVIDNNNSLMLVWSSPTTSLDPNSYMLRHLYERTATIGTGTAMTWNSTIHDLTSDYSYNFTECQYPDVAQNTSTVNFFVLFQADDYAGSYVKSIGISGYSGQTSPDDNNMIVLTVSKASVGGNAITVSSPNGGEYWLIGSVHNITWTSSGVTNVKIEYTANNGTSWNTIIASYPAGSGSYSWTIPNNPSTLCKVRISDSGNPSINDLSNSTFTISSTSQSITVTSPNGGENWQVGSIHDINWTSSGVANVKIEYTTDNGNSWTTIISTYPASGGNYAWTVPNTPSTQCKVRISDSGNASLYDMSDNVFTISYNNQSISVTNPNGGENWQAGGVYNITWTSSGVTNVKIEYTTDNGSSWTNIISTYVSGAGSYSWTVPNTPSTQCKVRISDSGNPSLNDMSENVFTISTSSQSILVTNPNGGETWQVGSVQNITWASSGITNVKIEYTTNNGTSWTTIISSYPAIAGSYPWAVPNNPSTQCKVRISDSGNASLSDISDNTFTISTGGQSTPEICIVTVDSATNKNMIVWEKPYSTTINHYNIYVESSQANVYTPIGSVPYNSLSIFTDYSSNSLQQANRYKISIVDINSVETALSDEHMTIHLTINQGIGNTFNLLWNNYEGFTYPSFNIYRGTSPTNMSLLATVASTLNSFTDLYPPGGYVYYKIEVVKPVPCSPSKTVIGSSVSNMSTNDPALGADPGSSVCSEVQIFPNPTTGLIKVVSDRVIGEVYIYNSMGIQVQAFQADLKEMTLDLSNRSKGVYYLKLSIENKTQVHKIIVL
jgi:Secretion system C-terminal sorting domain